MARHPWSLLLSAFMSLACNPMAHAESLESGIDKTGFDRSVRPQDDLFRFVNGEWLKHAQIPADKSNYGSFIELSDEAQFNLKLIIEEAAASHGEPGSNRQMVGDFYRSYLNEDPIKKAGLQPLRAHLDAIASLENVDQLLSHFGALQPYGVESPIGLYVSPDSKDSDSYLTTVIQSGITLPDRDYYLKDDEKYVTACKALQRYVRVLFELAELEGGKEAAASILELEGKLATIQWERTELRDAEKRYNKMTVAKLNELTPTLTWSKFLAAADVDTVEELNVATPSFFHDLQPIIRDTPMETWKSYVRFHLLDRFAPLLTEPFINAHFELHSKELAGIPELKPRWKRGVDAVAGAGAGDFGALGEAVGELYVQRHFPPAAKARMDELVGNLLKAYESSINDLSWMTPTTKQRALEKLGKIRTKIGYPSKWRSYQGLLVKPNDLIGNTMRSDAYEYQRMIKRLGTPVDRELWGMTPQTVNAYYNPTMNEIVFPAAILQPPFFNASADAAANYGGIGAVIGHEISHGFDDQGSKYDGDGNLQNWWTDDDRGAFQRLTTQLVAQYANYEPLPGKLVNGRLTLGENIADLSGLSIALKAYRLSLDGQEPPDIDGWTGQQRFFLGWSQVWRRKYRDAELLRRLVVDPHSPSAFRANGPISNIDAFYEAFGVQPGDQLFKPKAERIEIW